DSAIRHVVVKPLVDASPDDHHRAPASLLGVRGKLARDTDDFAARNARYFLLPRGRVRNVVIVAARNLATEASIHAIVGEHQVVNGRDESIPVGQLDAPCGNPTLLNLAVRRALEELV